MTETGGGERTRRSMRESTDMMGWGNMGRHDGIKQGGEMGDKNSHRYINTDTQGESKIKSKQNNLGTTSGLKHNTKWQETKENSKHWVKRPRTMTQCVNLVALWVCC